MLRVPTLAEGAFVSHILSLCFAFASANLTIDSDVEQGKTMERKAFGGIEREKHGKVAEFYKQSLKNNEWWTHRSCKIPFLLLSGCPETIPQKCFGIEISYAHRVETDEQFPHWVEFLRHFPKCWRWIAPLVCHVHYRPCAFMGNPGAIQHHIVLELFRAQLCNVTRSHCDFALRHFPQTAASYLRCDARVRRLESTSHLLGNDGSLQQGSVGSSSSVPVYHTNCDLNFYTSSSRNETGQLEDQAKSCLAPLVYVSSTEGTQQTHALPLVDECYIPCSSTVYDANSLSVLNTFTFLCFFLVLVLALLLLFRVKLIFDFGIFICFLAIASTSIIALTFALSPFLGNGVVCLLGGKIRRFSGIFALANGNDILCMMEAAYLKVCLVFAFWASFIFVCNDLLAKFLFLQQFSAFCHILTSLLITLWHREISIDPVSKVCHYFRFRSLLPSIADFVSLLLVAIFILFLSKAKKKEGNKGFPMDQVLISTTAPQKESSIRSGSKSGADHRAEEVVVQRQQCHPSLSQKLIDALTRQISPLFLLFAHFGCVLSFYSLAEKDESDLLSAQINCSLSAIYTERWKNKDFIEDCRAVPRTPFWYYANSLAVVVNLVLTLSVISGSLSNLLNSGNGNITNDGEETEDEDNKNELEMGTLANEETAPSTQGNQRMNRNRTNLSRNNDSNCRASVADSICSHGYAAIDSSASTHSNEARRSRRRRLATLQGGRGRNRERMERGRLTTVGQNEEEMDDGTMPMQATTPSSYSDSFSALYEMRRNQQSTSFVGDFTGPAFPAVPPQQLPIAPTATAPAAPVLIIHHWHQYYPADGVHFSQNCNQQQNDDGERGSEFAVGKEAEINGTENYSGKNSCDERKEAEEEEKRTKDEEEMTEDSDYPISDHDTADSNDFCSDNSDPAEEQLWNESCRKAVESQQAAQI